MGVVWWRMVHTCTERVLHVNRKLVNFFFQIWFYGWCGWLEIEDLVSSNVKKGVTMILLVMS